MAGLFVNVSATRRNSPFLNGENDKEKKKQGCFDAPEQGGYRPMAKHDSISAFEVLDLANTDTDWLIEGIWPVEDSLMIYGPSRAGKTFLALDMTLALAYGHDWHGYGVPRPRKVLYVPSEGRRGIAKRLRAWYQFTGWMGLRPDEVDLLENRDRLAEEFDVIRQDLRAENLTGEEFGWYMSSTDLPMVYDRNVGDVFAALKAEIHRLKPDVVVFDVLLDFAPDVDENSRQVGHLIKALSFDKLGVTPLFIHHTGHEQLERPRGHSSIIAANDVQIGVGYSTQNEGRPNHTTTLFLHNTKQKNEDPFPPLQATLTKPNSDYEFPVITEVTETPAGMNYDFPLELTEAQWDYVLAVETLLNAPDQGETYTPKDLRESTGKGTDWEKGHRKELVKKRYVRVVEEVGNVPHLTLTEKALDALEGGNE